MTKKVKMNRTAAVYFDHKDVKSLQRHINQFGKLEPRKKTGLTEMQQRRLGAAVKRARHLALLPFVNHG